MSLEQWYNDNCALLQSRGFVCNIIRNENRFIIQCDSEAVTFDFAEVFGKSLECSMEYEEFDAPLGAYTEDISSYTEFFDNQLKNYILKAVEAYNSSRG